jgi:Domain of unknown function (DUF1707)
MAGTPATGRPRSLITEADRERLVARLGEHYARGELELDELRRRVEVVLAATYLDEGTAAVADLPQVAGPVADPGAGPPGPGRAPRPRRRGHGQAARPGAGWVRTSERFRDPTSRVIMRVWVDPSTDPETRHYLPDSE